MFGSPTSYYFLSTRTNSTIFLNTRSQESGDERLAAEICVNFFGRFGRKSQFRVFKKLIWRLPRLNTATANTVSPLTVPVTVAMKPQPLYKILQILLIILLLLYNFIFVPVSFG